MNATIAQNEIAVRFSSRPDIQREFLEIDIPNGWDDVVKIKSKILLYNGKKFAFVGWNSDSMKCYFARPLFGEIETAEIK